MTETYFCRFCNGEVAVSYAAGHIAKHFQNQQFGEAWLRNHFDDFYYKRRKSLDKFVDLEKDFGFTV